MTGPNVRILHLEDDPVDAELIAATLAAGGLQCDYVRATSRVQFAAALDGPYDLILSDYALPGFGGVSAQTMARERRPDLPFVFVSGTIGEEVAVDRLKEGATDYVLKQRLARLPAAVRRALDEARERRERREAESEVRRLNEALEGRVAERTAQLADANAALALREADLTETKSFLEHLLAASPSMIFRFEPANLRVTYVSPNIGWLLGYAPDEVLNVPGFWQNIIHPDERHVVVGRLRNAMDTTVAQIEQEYRCCSKDGRYRWFFNLLRIDYDTEARPVAILGYALDITDRKAAEEEVRRANVFLDSIVENLPHMVFVKDAVDLRFIRLNRAGEEMMGRPRTEIIGRTDVDVLPAALAAGFAAADRGVLAGGVLVDIPEEVLAVRHRQPRILHTKKIPLLDAQGAPLYLLGISEDITERRAAEEVIRLARLEAERANRAKSEFLSRMSHDLRTPLNAILGFAQILEIDLDSPADLESVGQILNGGRHLLDLINEVLDLASIDAGRLSLSLDAVPVADVVQAVVNLLRPLATARRITLTSGPGPDAALHVRADSQRLKQVLVNLIGNAVKYNRDGGTVHVSWAAADDGVIRTSVSDSGAGISPHQMALLFQPFERLGAERSRTEGTGLGLAVAKGLAEAMGGRLDVASQVGAGTTFWIDLPRADVSGDASADSPVSVPASTPDQAAGTVLYIEDNPSNTRLVQRLLSRRSDVRLLSATTGEDGIAVAKRDRPDLILLDLHLPDTSGEDVLAALRASAETRGIPVAVLSADVLPERIDQLMAAGAVAYLTKPINVASLLRLIDRTLPPGPVVTP